MIVDTHAHLTLKGLREDVQGVLRRARANGVDAVITVGIDLAIFERLRSRKKTLVLASHDPQLLTSGLVDRTLLLPEGRWQDGDSVDGGAENGTGQ